MVWMRNKLYFVSIAYIIYALYTYKLKYVKIICSVIAVIINHLATICT